MEKAAEYQYLQNINSPADLKQLPIDALPTVCNELRQYLIEVLAENPGHFASSLGTVELTVALHYVYDTPNDLLVWDVGHQAYGHKVLTGRRDTFPTNRKFKGIRPFPTPNESEYDTFACGHASNSISAALGMSVASVQHGDKNKHVVAIIGDGAMSGGLAFEGLNNASDTPNNLLIILNDNNMSIDSSVGGMREYLHHLHTSSTYNKIRNRIARKLESWGWLNDKNRRRILRFNNSLKALLNNQQNVFEGMNIRYFGPTDGHDVKGLVKVLQEIMDMSGPKMLHLSTTKGKGYTPAEKEATIWHAPGKFDVESGMRAEDQKKNTPKRYQDIFGEALLELAKMNPKVVGVTPAMPTGCSMNILMNEMPNRAFDVGIAEGHAVTFSAGMAKEGLIPYCNIYSSFAQRAYDNVIHDAALLKLPIVLCLDRAGIVGEDGPTHHGVFDLASLRAIPNLTIASPYDENELRHLMYTAQMPGKGTFVIRYPRGCGRGTAYQAPFQEIAVGKGRCLKAGTDLAIISLGPIGNTVADSIAKFESQNDKSIAHYDLRFVKPLDKEMLHHIGQTFQKVITVEDGCIMGGMGSAVLEFMNDNGYSVKIHRLGIPDQFIEHGKPAELYHMLGIDEEGIVKTISELLNS